MNIFQRVSKLMAANINNLLDSAEDPEIMVKQLIRDMEESIIELRRETVKAIGAQKLLEKKTEMNTGQIANLEKKAVLALEQDNEALTRQILSKKLDLETSNSQMLDELVGAADLAAKMKEDLTKLEDQVQTARRKKEEIIRRKRAAQAQMRSQNMLKKNNAALNALTGAGTASIDRIESYKDKIVEMEAEVEATEEMIALEQQEADLEKLSKDRALEDELAKLKKKLEK